MKQLQGREIALVNVVWGGPAGGSMTWEREEQMRESYPILFSLGNFRGRKFLKWGRVVSPRFVRLFYLIYL